MLVEKQWVYYVLPDPARPDRGWSRYAAKDEAEARQRIAEAGTPQGWSIEVHEASYECDHGEHKDGDEHDIRERFTFHTAEVEGTTYEDRDAVSAAATMREGLQKAAANAG